MVGWQKLVLVTQVILPELARRITELLREVRNARIFLLEPDVGARQTDLRQTSPNRRLASDERSPAGRAALLAVPIGESCPFAGDAVDVGRLVTHDAAVVAARVEPTDV